jgi:HD-GYP domain-containing protein (c-di-GMP phosphodiesterase class II)
LDDLFVGESASTGREREHFRAVCQATQLLYSEHAESDLFERLMDLIQDYIPADHLYLFLKDPVSDAILPRATRVKGTPDSIPISRTILRRVIADSRAILTADAMQDERFKTGDSIVINQIRSVLCVPVQSGPSSMGAIYAVNARLAETFDETDLQLLTAIGTQLAFRIENMEAIRARGDSFAKLLGRFLAALEECAPGQLCHAERVCMYATAIANEMGLSSEDAYHLRLSALLHDIGKLKTISGLSGADADEDRDAVHVHRAEEVLQNVPGLQRILSNIHAHHERVDGEGVPHRLQGDKIPLGARILAVANGFDHVLESCREGEGEDDAIDGAMVRKAFTELTEGAGKAYDVEVIRALMVAYRHGALFPEEVRPGAADPDDSTPEDALPEPDPDAQPTSRTMRVTPEQGEETVERIEEEEHEADATERRDSTHRAAKIGGGGYKSSSEDSR